MSLDNTSRLETGWRPRVTVATVVPHAGRFLLVEETIRGKLVLNQPAGHLEENETLVQAAVRETLEETGWTVELTGLIGVYQWNTPDATAQYLRFAFAATAHHHDPGRTLDAGIVRPLWLSREDIAAQAARWRSPMVLANVDDWLAGRHFPLDAVRSLLATAAP
jgi:8-oxo-dGTP pyrophosphatase MutT (NUDIX family)